MDGSTVGVDVKDDTITISLVTRRERPSFDADAETSFRPPSTFLRRQKGRTRSRVEMSPLAKRFEPKSKTNPKKGLRNGHVHDCCYIRLDLDQRAPIKEAKMVARSVRSAYRVIDTRQDRTRKRERSSILDGARDLRITRHVTLNAPSEKL